jgi:hypothetical protein
MDLGIIHHLEQQQHIGLLQLSSLGVALNNTTKHTHERETKYRRYRVTGRYHNKHRSQTVSESASESESERCCAWVVSCVREW